MYAQYRLSLKISFSFMNKIKHEKIEYQMQMSFIELKSIESAFVLLLIMIITKIVRFVFKRKQNVVKI